MLDLVIDIETPGTGPDAAVLSIGAVRYDRTSGQIVDQFYGAIDANDALRYGSSTEDTMAWWRKQDPRAFSAAFGGSGLSVSVAEKFAAFARGTMPWGNGSVFDVIILEHLFRQHSIKCPWLFWNIRDLRTVVDVAEYLTSFNKKEIPFATGFAHHALHDAVHETHILSAALAALAGKTGGPSESDLQISY